MSDSRDTNHDGHVSLTDKIKDKLHLHRRKHKKDKGARTSDLAGHSSLPIAQPVNSAHSLNQDHQISTGSKLVGAGAIGAAALGAAGVASGSGFDSRDLNRDEHVFASEQPQSTGFYESDSSDDSGGFNRDGQSAGFHDSHDLDRGGQISTNEKLATDIGPESEQARLTLHEEQLAVSKREVSAGAVDLVKRVQEEHVERSVPVTRQEIVMERRPYSGDDSSRIPEKDEIARVVLYREEVVTEKRIVPNEEVVVRKGVVTDQATVGATLRSEYVETSQMGTTSASAGDISPAKQLRDDSVSMKAARG